MRVCLPVAVGHGGCWLVGVGVGVGVILCRYHLGDPKIDKIHKIHAPKIQGLLFPGKKSACGKHIDHGVLGGILKSTKIDKIHKIHAPKFQDEFFLRSPKRRRQLGHRRTGLGDLKPVNNVIL